MTTKLPQGCRRLLLPLLLALPLAMAGPDCLYAQPLPEMGNAQGSLVDMTREQSIAEQVMRNLRHDDLILEDPLLNEYIQNLGNRIANEADWQRGNFHFFIVKDMEINAFALPAGYIGINAGLILRTQTEDELAAVLAHEISHITQRHHNRASEYIKQQDVLLAAAIIAALAAGANDSSASMAILMGSMASNLHANLAYSRSNEQEADRVGIELLYRAGFDGQGMVEFFDKLHQSQRYNNSEAATYLSTHPVTLERLSDARNRLKSEASPSQTYTSDYGLMWQRLAHLAAVKSGQYPEPEANDISRRYQQVLALEASEQYEKIITLLKPEPDRQPGSIPLIMYLADTYNKAGNSRRSLKLYRQLHELYPTQPSITLAYCEQLVGEQQLQQAKGLLRETMQKQRIVTPAIYKMLADIELKLGQKASAHRYLATYYFETGRPHHALQQLDLGLADKGLSFNEKEELEAQRLKVRQHIELLSNLP